MEKSQPDTIKEIRIKIAKMTEATDREIFASAIEFKTWIQSLQDDLLQVAGSCPVVT